MIPLITAAAGLLSALSSIKNLGDSPPAAAANARRLPPSPIL
jgi:hypothetical protein